MDLGYILPSAGIHENGREIDGLDDRLEFAHHMMLVNLLRILGAVKNKASKHFSCPLILLVYFLRPYRSAMWACSDA
jgi:3-oxoacyl-ACP reductase-like protein